MGASTLSRFYQSTFRGLPGVADIAIEQKQGRILCAAQQPFQCVQGSALLSLVVHQKVIEELKHLQPGWMPCSGKDVMFTACFMIMTQGGFLWAGQIRILFGLHAHAEVRVE